MKVSVTIDVGDDYRAAVRARIGETGKATRGDVADHFASVLRADIEELMHEYANFLKYEFGDEGGRR